eukprot:gene8812-762_t
MSSQLFQIVVLTLVFTTFAVQCGTGLNKVGFQTKYDTNTKRTTYQGLSCPGYDWTSQKTPNKAAAQCIQFEAPTTPIISKSARDAFVYEGATFDKCAGHNSPGKGMSQENGIYHYHNEPGKNCVYTGVLGKHSPLFAVMYDGVPLYGVFGDNGTYPTNLDECNGHVDITYPYYHYHLTANSKYPYTVNCLKGCLENTSPQINGVACDKAEIQYDYSSLKIQLNTHVKQFDCATATVTPTISTISSDSMKISFSFSLFIWS